MAAGGDGCHHPCGQDHHGASPSCSRRAASSPWQREQSQRMRGFGGPQHLGWTGVAQAEVAAVWPGIGSVMSSAGGSVGRSPDFGE